MAIRPAMISVRPGCQEGQGGPCRGGPSDPGAGYLGNGGPTIEEARGHHSAPRDTEGTAGSVRFVKGQAIGVDRLASSLKMLLCI